MKSIKQIKANVRYNWDSTRTKFEPFDQVCVTEIYNESKAMREKVGHTGFVIAVSIANDGKIRGRTWPNSKDQSRRAFTRYYVEFNDGQVFGIHSHYLDLV